MDIGSAARWPLWACVWDQPWQPLFLVWRACCYPLPSELAKGCSEPLWTFDGTQLALRGHTLTAGISSQEAPTDGTLVLTLRTDVSGETTVDVRTTPATEQPTTVYRLTTRDTSRSQHLHLPVGKGGRITLRPEKGKPVLDAAWFPLGLAGKAGHLAFSSTGTRESRP